MKNQTLSRRAFLRSATDVAGNSCIVLSLPMILAACEQASQARLNEADFITLSVNEAEEFQAIAARIIPSDESPGATEAGTVYFIDNVLGDSREAELNLLRQGLQELQMASATSFSTSNFHELNDQQQDQLLTNVEDSEFFGTIRYLTIAGMFSLPEYGGNRNNVGYDIIGFDEQHAWQPPFGFYDADYTQRGQ